MTVLPKRVCSEPGYNPTDINQDSISPDSLTTREYKVENKYSSDVAYLNPRRFKSFVIGDSNH